MTAPDQLAELLKASFPVEPLPRVFWGDGAEQSCGDIPDELARRLARRRWVDVTMHDWTMIGHACIAKPSLHPDGPKRACDDHLRISIFAYPGDSRLSENSEREQKQASVNENG